jgi:hypothetical protein
MLSLHDKADLAAFKGPMFPLNIVMKACCNVSLHFEASSLHFEPFTKAHERKRRRRRRRRSALVRKLTSRKTGSLVIRIPRQRHARCCGHR